MLKGFRDFLMRGNLIELAVAFVIGAAVVKLVAALVDALITPLLALIVGKPSFGEISFSISGTKFPIGLFLNEAFTFVATAAAVYFFIVVPYQRAQSLLSKGGEDEATLTKDQELLIEIRDSLKARG